MSRSLNKVMLIGHVGSEPEIRSTAGGSRVGKLSLATNRTWNDRAGQKQEHTDWHRLTFFGKLADVVEQYVNKGDRIYAEGRIQYSQTQDDNGGTRYWTDVVVSELIMLGNGTGAIAQREGRAATQDDSSTSSAVPGWLGEEEQDLPF